MGTKTHYKNFFDDNFLNSGDVNDKKDTIVEIIKVYSKTEKTSDGDKAFTCIGLVGYDKPMKAPNSVLDSIGKALKLEFVEDWVGKKISIYVLKNLKAFGKLHDVIRVRPQAPKDMEIDLSPYIDLFKKAKTMEQVKKAWEYVGEKKINKYGKVVKAKNDAKSRIENK